MYDHVGLSFRYINCQICQLSSGTEGNFLHLSLKGVFLMLLLFYRAKSIKYVTRDMH